MESRQSFGSNKSYVMGGYFWLGRTPGDDSIADIMSNMAGLTIRCSNTQTGSINAGMKFVTYEAFARSLTRSFYDINKVRHGYLAP